MSKYPSHFPMPHRKAIQAIQFVAQQYGITDAFDLFDESMIDHKFDQLIRLYKENPARKDGMPIELIDLWICLVEDELGIDPGEPRERAEYAQFMREGGESSC